MLTTYSYMLNVYSYIDMMFKQVKKLQIRKRKCNVANIFNLMISAQHADNNE